MKMHYFLKTTALYIIIAGALMTGCQKNGGKKIYTLQIPIYKTVTELRNSIKVKGPESIKTTGKIYISGKYLLMCEQEAGIHIIDNSDPARPKNISFISIPGNQDMAVKGSILYADSYNDLVAFDISNPASASRITSLNNALTGSQYLIYLNRNAGFNPDSTLVITGYTKKDTLVSSDYYNILVWGNCPNYAFMNSDAGSKASSVSKGGSMARYSVVGDYLYIVSDYDLKVFDVSKPAHPEYKNKNNIGFGIETIYPFKDKLFIGSTTGMFIYDITQPESPVQLSTFSHATLCDPVVADDNYAYITLRSGSGRCRGISNEMNVVDISNVKAPVLKKTYPFTHPAGLSKDGDLIFVCDGDAGLKVYTTKDGYTLTLKKHFTGPDTYDVITHNNIALVVAKDGLYQYDYSDSNIRLLSHLKTVNTN